MSSDWNECDEQKNGATPVTEQIQNFIHSIEVCYTLCDDSFPLDQ